MMRTLPVLARSTMFWRGAETVVDPSIPTSRAHRKSPAEKLIVAARMLAP